MTGFYNETNSNETKLREFVSFDVTNLRRDPDFIRSKREKKHSEGKSSLYFKSLEIALKLNDKKICDNCGCVNIMECG